MTQSVDHFRVSALRWLLGLDTRLSEFTLGAAAIVNGVQVMTTHNGESLAPFLNSAFRWLAFDGPYWLCILAVVGVMRLFCLALGIARNNCYLPRGVVSLVDSLMWSAIVVAIMTGPEPPMVAIRYTIAALVSYVVALVLWLKHDVGRHQEQRSEPQINADEHR